MSAATSCHLPNCSHLPPSACHPNFQLPSTSVTLVNKAAVDYFFVELHLETHFEALRHFLLMEDGEFAQSLSDLLFEKVILRLGVGIRLASGGVLGRMWVAVGLGPTQTCHAIVPKQHSNKVLLGWNSGCGSGQKPGTP